MHPLAFFFLEHIKMNFGIRIQLTPMWKLPKDPIFLSEIENRKTAIESNRLQQMEIDPRKLNFLDEKLLTFPVDEPILKPTYADKFGV